MVETILSRIGDYVYSVDGKNLVDVVAEKLMTKKLSISCAESCTGGLFAATLTKIPGISTVFDRGYVTYSNRSKMEELGVSMETLETYGAVSAETAEEMVRGVYENTGSNLCIAVTGIAGPDGGTEEKPVGLSHIALLHVTETGQQTLYQETLQTKRNDRDKNRHITMLKMLHMLYKHIQIP